MSSGTLLPGKDYYENIWEAVQKPENREIIEALTGENQLNEEEMVDRVDLSEEEFYDAAAELEEKGVLDHYDQEYGRGHQTSHLSLYSVFYPAERALEFEDQENYVENMLEEDEEMLGQYEGDSQ